MAGKRPWHPASRERSEIPLPLRGEATKARWVRVVISKHLSCAVLNLDEAPQSSIPIMIGIEDCHTLLSHN